jgi:Prenyltransferase and squalene oxidase repeat
MQEDHSMATPDLDKATKFIWSTARLLDRRRFAYLFLDGDSQAVLAALLPYQNPDGGFGSGLEPDIRGPVSQPVPTWTALGVFDEIGTMGDSIVRSICDYLVSITTEEGGVPFVLPSVREYPHAPWWETEGTPPASLNPTAAIAALLHKHHVEHPWLSPATEYCWRQIDRLDQTSPYEMRAVLPFLDYVPDRPRAEAAFDRVGPKILEQKLVALTPTTEEETHSPLNFAPRLDCLARRLFTDDVIAAHLDDVASSQQEDGGWKFNWLAWNPAAALEWRAIVAIESLVTLKAYGRQV